MSTMDIHTHTIYPVYANSFTFFHDNTIIIIIVSVLLCPLLFPFYSSVSSPQTDLLFDFSKLDINLKAFICSVSSRIQIAMEKQIFATFIGFVKNVVDRHCIPYFPHYFGATHNCAKK